MSYANPRRATYTPRWRSNLPSGPPTVLNGNMPAATVGCSCVCVGPPDSIVKGSSTVMIEGKPAARMGDSTAHGGSIVAGCPTVEIGG